MLHKWYNKLGYNIMGEVDFKKTNPVCAAMTKYHMVLKKYQKQLIWSTAKNEIYELDYLMSFYVALSMGEILY